MPQLKDIIYTSVRFTPRLPPRINMPKLPPRQKCDKNKDIATQNLNRGLYAPELPPRPRIRTENNQKEKLVPIQKKVSDNPTRFKNSKEFRIARNCEDVPKLPIRKCDLNRKDEPLPKITVTKAKSDTNIRIKTKITIDNDSNSELTETSFCSTSSCLEDNEKSTQTKQSGGTLGSLVYLVAALVILNSVVMMIHLTLRTIPPHGCPHNTDEEIITGVKPLKVSTSYKRQNVNEDKARHYRETIMKPHTEPVPYRNSNIVSAATESVKKLKGINIARASAEHMCSFNLKYSHTQGKSMMCTYKTSIKTTSLEKCIQFACQTKHANAINFLASERRCNVKICKKPFTDSNLKLTYRFRGSDIYLKD